MSNILTSYVRIYPKIGPSIPHDKQLWILKNIVKFGSHYVRIWMGWNPQDRCLEIQYGSDYSNWLFFQELSKDYYVWERVANGGGFNDVLISHQENVDISEDCIYGFDAMLVDKSVSESSIPYFPREIVDQNYLLTVKGEYTASNDLSFVDVGDVDEVSLYYNEPNYIPGNNVYGEIALLTPLELSDLIYCRNDIADCFIKLQWKGRTVYQRSWQLTEDEPEGEWIASCRDTWDNILNEVYLAFKAKFHPPAKACVPSRFC